MWALRFFYPCIIVLITASCSSVSQQNVQRVNRYQVKKTDTLYSIAWRYGHDYRNLAKWNGLKEPYRIYPGQRLILSKPDRGQPLPTQHEANRKETVPGVYDPVKKMNTSPGMIINWRWPTAGILLNSFSAQDLDRQGIDIAGKIGQPVRAVADGKVVYSGTGLAGYGNLVIVKHNNTYLSAYAYNRKRLVKEGMKVNRGKIIAEMGLSKKGTAVLHFQIRKKGQPVDPLKYLPKL